MFQMAARRIVLAAVLHGRDALHRRGNDGRLGPLLWRHESVRFVGTRAVGRFAFGATLDGERELLDSLPAMLDRIDAWISAGVLNAEALNAADFMIVSTLALLCYRRDLRPGIKATGRCVDRPGTTRAVPSIRWVGSLLCGRELILAVVAVAQADGDEHARLDPGRSPRRQARWR